jgi:fibronectin-binding autotransporter adhesin
LVNGGGGGGLTKQGSGTLHLDGVNTYTGATLVNTGSLGVGPGGVIAGPVTVASGATLDGDIGAIGLPFSINNTLALSAGSSTFIQITPTNNDEIIGLTSVSYGGALVVTNASGSPLTVGKQYLLFNAADAGTGHFSSITVLSSTGSYTGTFSAATGILTIGAGATAPILNSPKVASGNLILTGSGGTPAGTYSLLSSTNVTIPIGQWITNTTGVFDGSGDFSNSIPISHSTPAQFFDVKTP